MAIVLDGTTGITNVDGSAAAPAFKNQDANTGLSGSADQVVVSTGGSERFRVASAGQLGVAGANYGTSGQVLTSGGASAAPSWASASSTGTSGTDNFTIADGNLVIGTAGHGIDFSAQTASSKTGVTVEDEVLDHYEKGTWTPFFFGSTTAGTFSVSVRPARYVRIGDLVWINMYIQGGSLSGAGGDLKIGGLPYDLEGSPDAAFTVAYANGFNEMPDNSVLFVINGGSNTLRILKSAAHYAGNTSGLAVSSDNMAIVIGGCYSVA